MYEFLEYVLYELKNSLALVLLAGIGAMGILAVTFLLYGKKYSGQRAFPWGRALLWLVFAGYLAIVVYATLLRGSGGYRQWNLHLFRAWREAWNNFSAKNWANVLLNVAMFGPMGFMLPLLGKKFRKWYLTIPAAFGVSMLLELAQLISAKGIWDVDDLFANTLGAAMGYFLILMVLSFRNPKGSRLKGVLACGAALLMLVGPICGIFLVYAQKEYGNLPMAPAYTNNTGAVTWILDCALPDVAEEAVVYRTQTRSLEACDAFAEEFRKIIGTQYDSILYYQEAAYYMDHSGDENGAHFLFVSYLDPSYEYDAASHDTPVWTGADRETVEAALGKFPCMIPEYAQFSIEENGWYCFSVDQHIDGAAMIDGELRCRLSEDGTVREIENHLLTYTYYNMAQILSGEEAYQRLCAGKFNDNGYFSHKAPDTVRVFSCSLAYEIDTKGFYQPVYYLDVASPDGSYQDRILIPAMK